jgi:hypothetical protein
VTFHGRYARALTSENLLQAYVRTTIASLLQNKVDISELIITKSGFKGILKHRGKYRAHSCCCTGVGQLRGSSQFAAVAVK